MSDDPSADTVGIAPPPLDGLTPAQRALAAQPPPPLDLQQVVLEGRFQDLCDLVTQYMTPDLAASYVQLLVEIADDQTYLGKTYLGLIRAPAARGNHHDREGGLVEHLLEMWRVWTVLRDGLTHDDPDYTPPLGEDPNAPMPQISDLIRPPHVTDERVLCAIINHDLHKGWTTYVAKCYYENGAEITGPWEVEYGGHESDSLLNHTLKSLFLLNSVGIHPDIEQLNALALAEGGWSDQKNVREASVLAKLCYTLDELSGNVLERVQKGNLLEVKRTFRPGWMDLPAAADQS